MFTANYVWIILCYGKTVMEHRDNCLLSYNHLQCGYAEFMAVFKVQRVEVENYT